MVARHISMRGEVVDMEKLRLTNGDQVALGNASKNARGDVIGPGGVVLKTQEQIEQEWAAAKARADAASPKPMNLKADDALAKALASLAPKAKPTMAQDDGSFEEPTPQVVAEPQTKEQKAQQGSRRRVVESDD